MKIKVWNRRWREGIISKDLSLDYSYPITLIVIVWMILIWTWNVVNKEGFFFCFCTIYHNCLPSNWLKNYEYLLEIRIFIWEYIFIFSYLFDQFLFISLKNCRFLKKNKKSPPWVYFSKKKNIFLGLFY